MLPLLFENLWITLYMVTATLLLGGLLGLVLGVFLYTTRKGSILQNVVVFNVLNVIVNIFRPIPFIILIAALGPVTLAVVGTTIGSNAAIFTMVVGATFGIARIVEQNLVTIDPGTIEAARAAGAGPWRIILTLLIPEALGPLILGYTFVFIAIVDMSAIAGSIGGRGLGDFAIQYGYARFNWEITFVVVVVIVILVQVVQFLGNWLARKALRR
ncbi:methionine ABC transporter permease [Compostimonas suwonensis]|nr:methionine ABC transporter permease [Compostimonas suwonensis]